MKRLNQCLKGLFLISILFSAVRGPHAQTTKPVPKDDVQFWNDTQLAIPMSKKVDFVLQGTIRIRTSPDAPRSIAPVESMKRGEMWLDKVGWPPSTSSSTKQ